MLVVREVASKIHQEGETAMYTIYFSEGERERTNRFASHKSFCWGTSEPLKFSRRFQGLYVV